MENAPFKASRLLTAAMLILCVASAYWMLDRSMKQGSIYPAYSSYRSDPFGVKVLYRALLSMPRIACRRSHVLLRELPERTAAVLFIGVKSEDPIFVHKETAKALRDLASQGHRLVITLHPAADPMGQSPVTPTPGTPTPGTPVPPGTPPTGDTSPGTAPAGTSPVEATPSAGQTSKPAASPQAPASTSPAPTGQTPTSQTPPAIPAAILTSFSDITETWGFRISRATPAPEFVVPVLEDDLPEELPWRSSLVFADAAEQWETVYLHNKHPVIIRRRFGRGEVVMVGDSYWASNEGMHRDPAFRFPAWLFRDCEVVIFDELHHGIRSQEGIGGLIRRHGLQGFLLGLLLLGTLYAWRATSSFMPRLQDDELAALQSSQQGRDSMSGIINLLKRNIRLPNLLATCVEVWRRDPTEVRQWSDDCVHEVTGLAGLPHAQTKREEEILEMYRQIYEIIQRERQR